jgi:hypothetical protein
VRGGSQSFSIRRRGARALSLASCLTAGAALIAGCGGGSPQTHGEKKASYAVEVVHASFPRNQAVAKPATLEIEVHNSGAHAVPNLTVSLDSLNYRSNYPGLADALRPVWAIERGPGPVAKPPVQSQEVSIPGGGQTAYVNTWALGALAAGATRTFTWNVVAVKPGAHVVHYTIAAGLGGNAKATGKVTGSLTADVASEPPATHVDPSTGKVVSGTSYGKS